MWTYIINNIKTFIYYALQLIEKNPLTSQQATLSQAQTNVCVNDQPMKPFCLAVQHQA